MSCLNTLFHPNNGRWRVQFNPLLNVPGLLPGKIALFFFFSDPKTFSIGLYSKIFNEILKRHFKIYIEQSATIQLILRLRRHFLNQILRASDGRTLHLNREFYNWISVFSLLFKSWLIFATIKQQFLWVLFEAFTTIVISAVVL